MPDTLDARAKSIIDEVIDLDPPARSSHVERGCAGDPELRRRVDSLLAAIDKDDGFLRQPTVNIASPLNPPAASDTPGSRIGPYTLAKLIGEGGFGSVYLAEQHEPVRRQVALKIIKLGMDTRAFIARFEQERQALALMDHPHIARVLDAGATESGRPYFAMELVRGEPITAYCDREKLSVAQRLQLFAEVCRAVQHAHQKGIIHRDLKPSNVLVADSDGAPLPKVIDFGIAKAVATPLTDKTLITEAHHRIGTPQYMSPEQAEPTCEDIDTRSDIYSLGVLLYELLTGTTPFDGERLRQSGYDGMVRILREEDPPRPSLRVNTPPSSGIRIQTPTNAGATGASSSVVDIAQRRQTRPGQLNRALRGDLDWIVMKCLEKDRRRRYETASALAEDIERHLAHQSVTASPPSKGYRLRKFVRRNFAAVAAGGAVILTLLIATVVSVAFGLSEARHRKDAEDAKIRAESAEVQSSARAKELDQVARFQQAQLASIDPKSMGLRIRSDLLEKARAAVERSDQAPEEVQAVLASLEKSIAGTDFTGIALGALDENFFQPALTAIDRDFADQPLLQAQLLQTVADTLLELGLLQVATNPQTRALDIRRQALGDDHADTLESIAAMGLLLNAQGRRQEAEPYYRDALDRRRRVLGDEHPDTLRSIQNMGGLLQALGRFPEAEPYYLEALEKRRRILGEDHRDTLTVVSSVGFLYNAMGQDAKAEPYYREALEKRRRVLGEEHPHTLFSINNMAALMQMQRRYEEAEPLYLEALEKRRRVLGDDHPDTLQTVNNLGNLLEEQKRNAEAEPYYREALEKRRRLLGDEHPHTLNSIANMGSLLSKLDGKESESEALTREALETRRRRLGNDHPETLYSVNNMGMLLEARGRFAEAEPYLREALVGVRRAHGEEHSYTFMAVINLTSVLESLGRFHEAAEIWAGLEPAARRKFKGADDPRLGRFLINLGKARIGAGHFREAQENLTEAHTILSVEGLDGRWNPADALTELARLYDAWHAAEPLSGHDARAAEWRAKLGDGRMTTPPAAP